MSHSKGSFGSYVWTFTLGALTGATVALLFAPMTGRRLQRKVADVSERVRDVVEDSVENVQSAFRKVTRT